MGHTGPNLMPLATPTLAQLTGSDGRPTPAGDDRRRHARVPMGTRAQCRFIGTRAWRTVLVRDLSADGVGLQHDEPLAKGQPLVIRLPGPAGGLAELPCVVRWCEPGGFLHAGFLIGAAFVDPPPAQGPGPARPTWLADLLVDRRARQG